MGFLILCIRRINFDAKHGEWTWPNMGFGGRQDVNLKVKGALIIKYPNMVVSWNGGTPKSSILMVLSTFPYKPSIWGYLHFRKPPHTNWTNLNHQHMFVRFQEISTGPRNRMGLTVAAVRCSGEIGGGTTVAGPLCGSSCPFLKRWLRDTTCILCWLVVSNMVFIFHNIWDNLSHWLSYFSRWLTPPTRYSII